MKLLFSILTLISFQTYAQFGFTNIDSVDVIKNTLTLKYPWAGGIDYAQLSNIDLNQDGVQDLFIFDRSADKVLTFIQNGTNGQVDYTYAPEYEDNFPPMISWCLLADYNCDGKKDIFTYTIGGFKVYKNTSTSTTLQFELAKNILKTNIYGNDVYIYSSAIDIPSITDIDNDGDLDILAFGVGGSKVEYQRNMSMENYGVCDSLEFITGNICWGLFEESAISNSISLNQPCPGQVSNPYSVHPATNQDRHAGSTVLALDLDANGVMDLLLGDIAYNTITSLINGGTAPNTNSAMISFNTSFPSAHPVNIPIFPAAFHLDINNDNVRDLVVCPNSTVGSQNYEGVWYYENTGADNLPTFVHQQNDFLQGEMIDFGSGSYPVLFDVNGDEVLDLLVSIEGKYNGASGNQISKIAYFENTGTNDSPVYNLITDDYMNLSTLGLGVSLNFYPTFGDIDGDGDEDMILGEYNGYMYLFTNIAGAGNTANFILADTLRENDNTPIVDGIYPIPVLIDLDRDNDLDLVLGKRDGTLNYYTNIGDSANLELKLFYTNFGGVNVTQTGYVEGRAIPTFVDIDTVFHLLVGSKEGYIYYYDNINNNLSGNFDLVSASLDNINIGFQSAPFVSNQRSDNTVLMYLGNKRGGLGLYKSGSVSNVGLTQTKTYELTIYPNPTSDNFYLLLPHSKSQSAQLSIYDMRGVLIKSQNINQTKTLINTSHLSNGVYLIQLNVDGIIYSKKLIINA